MMRRSRSADLMAIALDGSPRHCVADAKSYTSARLASLLAERSSRMVDKPQPNDPSPSAPVAGTVAPARRGPGHRNTDMRDTVAELTERAQLISQEAGGKIAAAMKDVISAGAGIAGFAIESARDLVQFMVRRGQMTMEEGDKLIREAEAAHDKRSPMEKSRPTASKVAAEKAAVAKAEAAARAAAAAAAMPPQRTAIRPVVPPAIAVPAATPAAKPAAAPKSPPAKPEKTAAKPATKAPEKPAKPVSKNGGKGVAPTKPKGPAKAAAKAPKSAKPAKKKK
jgi:polyhydroxyalkanoate synthesis regulator phasin